MGRHDGPPASGTLLPSHDPARELREQGDPRTWARAVAAIGARHGVDLDHATPFPSGSDLVYGTAAHVLKLTAPRWHGEIAAEVRNLGWIEGRCSLRTPRVLATGELEGWPYVLMTRVEGVALAGVWPRLDGRERQRLAAELGERTAELHGLATGSLPDDWTDFRAACRADLAARHAGPDVPDPLVEGIEAFVDEHGTERGPRVFLHTELLDQHLLLDERGGRWRPGALIDFADGRLGPADYDAPALVEFVFRGEAGLLAAFLQGYGEDPTPGPARSRGLLAYGLLHRFGSLARMLSVLPGPPPLDLDELASRLYGTSAIR